MASKVEQQYKLLNAELMSQVQKQRIEIGLYRKQLVALKHENMGLREAQILHNARQREDHIGIIRSLMRRLEIDADCLADSTIVSEQEPELSSNVVNRRRHLRRSSKEICMEMRQSSALAGSTRTISPSRRRDSVVEAPNEAPSSPSLRRDSEAEAPNEAPRVSASSTITSSPSRRSDSLLEPPNEAPRVSASSTITSSPSRRSDSLVEPPNEAPRVSASSTITSSPSRRSDSLLEAPNKAPRVSAGSTRTISPSRRREVVEEPKEAPRLSHTPSPRRVAEIACDTSSEEEEETANPISNDKEKQPVEKVVPKLSEERLCSIDEDTDEDTYVDIEGFTEEDTEEETEEDTEEYTEEDTEKDTEGDTSMQTTSDEDFICCDSTIQACTPSQRVLRSVNPNILPVAKAVAAARGKPQLAKSLAIDVNSSVEEEPSIQIPRLMVTRPSQSPVRSQFTTASLAYNSSSSPRHSLFEGTFQMRDTNTSTPIANKSSQQRQAPTEKASESASSSGLQPKVRIRKLTSEPGKPDENTDLSTSCLSSSGRPRRKCQPTQLLEPSLRAKLRNNSKAKK